MSMISFSSALFGNYLVVSHDQVVITSKGMFATVDGISIEVQSLNAINDGSIVAIPVPQAAICPKCGCDRYVLGRFCPDCGFPDEASKS